MTDLQEQVEQLELPNNDPFREINRLITEVMYEPKPTNIYALLRKTVEECCEKMCRHYRDKVPMWAVHKDARHAMGPVEHPFCSAHHIRRHFDWLLEGE